MFNTELLSKKVGYRISKELNLDNDSEEVISYGIFAIIQMAYNILLVILFGAIFNVLIESLIVSFVIAILRKSSGGAHAGSAGICATIGTFISVLFGLISKININLNIIILIEVITFIWAYYIIFKLAPVDSVTKPIKTDKKKNRLKKSSIIILSIYLVIIIVNALLYFYTDIHRLLVYSTCIVYGIIWQVLSLTRIGHIIVKLMDTFFNIILLYTRGGKKNEKN